MTSAGVDVAVVVAAYNAERYLGETLESICAQDPAPRDVVVVDDGSDDRTADVLRHAPSTVRVLHQERRGAAAALNRGVASTDADMVGFCDDDDLWTPGRLARQLAALAEDPAIGGVSGMVEQFVSPDVADMSARVHVDTAPQVGRVLGTLLVRRTTMAAVGAFDEELDMPQIDWVVRAYTSGIRFASVDRVVLRRRIHDHNWSLLNTERSRAGLLHAARRDRERRLGVS
jgi:glycosyltransferase involved in cell wall biosynthesis